MLSDLQKKQAPDSQGVTHPDHIQLDSKVFRDEVRGIAAVSEDPSDPSGCQQDHLRSMAPEPRSHRASVRQVKIFAACQKKIGVTSLLKATDQRASDQPAVTGHEDSVRGIQIEAAPRTATW